MRFLVIPFVFRLTDDGVAYLLNLLNYLTSVESEFARCFVTFFFKSRVQSPAGSSPDFIIFFFFPALKG